MLMKYYDLALALGRHANKGDAMKRIHTIAILGGACFLLNALASSPAYTQGLQRSGNERLFTYQTRVTTSGVSGIGPEISIAAGKLLEINISATCTYEDSGHHTIAVRLHDLGNFPDHYVRSATADGQFASIMTGPMVGFQLGRGSPAFDVECDDVAEIEVIALGRVVQ